MQKIKQLYSIKTIGFLLYGIILAYATAILLQMFAQVGFGKFWFEQIHWLTLGALAVLYIRRYAMRPYVETPAGEDVKTSIFEDTVFWVMLFLPWLIILPALIILFFAYIAFVMDTGHYLP
jgi:hypothetical protein